MKFYSDRVVTFTVFFVLDLAGFDCTCARVCGVSVYVVCMRLCVHVYTCVCVCVCVCVPQNGGRQKVRPSQQVSLLVCCCQFFPESLGGSPVSALTERVVDLGPHETTDERDGGSCFEYEGRILSANVSIAGTRRGRQVLDQGSPPLHPTWVCQATLRPDSELAGPRQVEEGRISPTADGRKRDVSSCRPKMRNCVKLRTGRRSMSSLCSSLVCSPAENLPVSQARLHSARRGVRRRRPFWYFDTWNVQSLLDSEGSVETARQGLDCRQVTEDQRIDLVVRELYRYKIPVAALQETKWFGQAVYCVGKSVVITAGRPTQQPGQSKERGEGVAVVFSGPAITTWKKGGEQWKTWGSRLIKVTLATGKKSSDCLHVLSCYAPPFAASRDVKEVFFDDLQNALDEIPPEESYVMLGDFNACVRSRSGDRDLWGDVTGPFGLGEMNEAGKEFLNVLLLNEATICNTQFAKNHILIQTWQHPKSKRWHCIDFAVMRQKDRRRCLDAAVRRGAECHTDHQLLRIKVAMTSKWFHTGKRKQRPVKYDVAKLQSGGSDSTVRVLFGKQ